MTIAKHLDPEWDLNGQATVSFKIVASIAFA
jgi:hypothetical protein